MPEITSEFEIFPHSVSCSMFSDFKLLPTLAVWKENRYYMALLHDASVGLGLEYFPEIFQKNKMARTPKNLQLGTQMAANPEVLEKWISGYPQRDLTTTGLEEKFYCLCV